MGDPSRKLRVCHGKSTIVEVNHLEVDHVHPFSIGRITGRSGVRLGKDRGLEL